MSEPVSVGDIDLSPIAGKTYFSIDRESGARFVQVDLAPHQFAILS